jgi:hypothetical protein
MDALWHAWRVLYADGTTTSGGFNAANVANRLTSMASFFNNMDFDGNGYLQLNLGYDTSIGSGPSDSPQINTSGDGSPDGVYTICPVNGLVMAYKMTGTAAYLTKAWTCWNNWQTEPKPVGDDGRTWPSAGTNDHYADSGIQSGNDYLRYNKGELQYSYALFEGAGSPVAVEQYPETVLASAAASLSAGQCLKLDTPLTGAELSPDGSSRINRSASSMVWDPVNREMRYIGKKESNNPLHFLVYKETTNTWEIDQYARPSSGPTSGHGYDQNACDPSTGDHYWRDYGSSTADIRKWNGSSWSDVPEPTIGSGAYSDANSISYIPEGLLLFDKNRLGYYNGSSWVDLGLPTPPSGDWTYHLMSEYNEDSDTVIFGGGNDHRECYKLGPSRGVPARIADFPQDMNLTSQNDRPTLCSAPGTNKFLLHGGAGSGTLTWWEYDVDNDAAGWVVLTESVGDGSSPQNGLPPLIKDGSDFHVTATPIQDYGVSMWVNSVSVTGTQDVWIYKHS